MHRSLAALALLPLLACNAAAADKARKLARLARAARRRHEPGNERADEVERRDAARTSPGKPTFPAAGIRRRSSGAIASSSVTCLGRQRRSACSLCLDREDRQDRSGKRRCWPRRWKRSTRSTASPRARRPPTASWSMSRSWPPDFASESERTPGDMVVAAYDFDGQAKVARQAGPLRQRARLLQLARAVRGPGDRQRRPRRRFVHRRPRQADRREPSGKSTASTRPAATSRRSFARSTAARK